MTGSDIELKARSCCLIIPPFPLKITATHVNADAQAAIMTCPKDKIPPDTFWILQITLVLLIPNPRTKPAISLIGVLCLIDPAYRLARVTIIACISEPSQHKSADYWKPENTWKILSSRSFQNW